MSDYAAVVDPTTEESAAYRNKYAANVAMATHTNTRAMRSFLGTTGGATGIADPTTGFVHDAVWGDGAAVKPGATYVATGTYDAIWPSSVNDELGVAHTPLIRRAWAQVESSDGTLRIATAKVTGAQTVRIYTFQAVAGLVLPAQLAGEIITIWWV